MADQEQAKTEPGGFADIPLIVAALRESGNTELATVVQSAGLIGGELAKAILNVAVELGERMQSLEAAIDRQTEQMQMSLDRVSDSAMRGGG